MAVGTDPGHVVSWRECSVQAGANHIPVTIRPSPRPNDNRCMPSRTTKTRTDPQPAPPHGDAAPRLPHERDESHDSAGDAPRDVIQQAHDDLASGKVDTDRGAVSDAAYRRQKTGGTANAAPPRRGGRR